MKQLIDRRGEMNSKDYRVLEERDLKTHYHITEINEDNWYENRRNVCYDVD